MRFYRDGIGLPEVGGFRGHAGYDGVFLALPGTDAYLELTAGGDRAAPQPHPETLLVLYLGDEAAVRSVADRLDGEAAAPANPYCDEHGLTFADPTGSASCSCRNGGLSGSEVAVRAPAAPARSVRVAQQPLRGCR